MMKETSVQLGERLLHDGDTSAHREQAFDFFGAQNRNGHWRAGLFRPATSAS
jgi:hypothetical protein